MRFTLIALSGLAVFGDNLGAFARAVPRNLAERAVTVPVPKVPVTVKPGDTVKTGETTTDPVTPETVTPETVTPETVTPETVTVEGATKKEGFQADAATVKADEAGAKEDPSAVSDDNVCGIVAARGLEKRERVPNDAADWKKVYLWLIKESGVDRNKMVFYSSSTSSPTKGLTMAKAFVQKNPTYYHFWEIFDDDFKEDFGDLGELDSEVVKACSKAMGLAAKTAFVFGHEVAAASSIWRTVEYPSMHRASTIYNMKDNAVSVSDRKGTIAVPDAPSAGSAGAC